MKRGKIPRRDKVFLAGQRMGRLTANQAAHAWGRLAHELYDLSEADIPKFADILKAIRQSTIYGRSHER